MSWIHTFICMSLSGCGTVIEVRCKEAPNSLWARNGIECPCCHRLAERTAIH